MYIVTSHCLVIHKELVTLTGQGCCDAVHGWFAQTRSWGPRANLKASHASHGFCSSALRPLFWLKAMRHDENPSWHVGLCMFLLWFGFLGVLSSTSWFSPDPKRHNLFFWLIPRRIAGPANAKEQGPLDLQICRWLGIGDGLLMIIVGFQPVSTQKSRTATLQPKQVEWSSCAAEEEFAGISYFTIYWTCPSVKFFQQNEATKQICAPMRRGHANLFRLWKQLPPIEVVGKNDVKNLKKMGKGSLSLWKPLGSQWLITIIVAGLVQYICSAAWHGSRGVAEWMMSTPQIFLFVQIRSKWASSTFPSVETYMIKVQLRFFCRIPALLVAEVLPNGEKE